MAFHPTKNLVASCSYDKSVKLWNTDTGAELWTVKVDNSVASIAYSPDGSKLAAAHYKTVSIFNMETNEVLCTVNVDSGVWSVAFSVDGTKLAAGCGSGKIYFVDPTAGEIKSSLMGHSAIVTSVCFSSDAKQLTSGSDDKTVWNWDLATRASLS